MSKYFEGDSRSLVLGPRFHFKHTYSDFHPYVRSFWALCEFSKKLKFHKCPSPSVVTVLAEKNCGFLSKNFFCFKQFFRIFQLEERLLKAQNGVFGIVRPKLS